ncbi:MAG: 50S ribosomal protein L30 [Clostridiales bacterium]|jgi:large subunit ribosomal protein L30|nr:50S ribosomal protein L30 [Clostridiales bacterium]MDD2571720.1 50S ribosomal protein L30 [Eubacteriales bacterium]MDY0119235.1 50S ribosomal protein L30 [Clostridia bacterium]NLG30861.1 50S ribosomal protein L30 [Clostridiaceae bacterium]MCK9349997.1 50S ribosomal protein L30 [Clostridiales bacterium]
MDRLKITLLRSVNSCRKDQVATVHALGLRKIGQSVIQKDNDAIRGMVRKVRHLVVAEPYEGGDDNEVE